MTSAIKQWDIALFEIIKTFTEGEFTPGISTLGLADGGVGLTPSQYLTEEHRTKIDELSADIVAGVVTVPRAPAGELLPPPGVEVSQTVTVTWDGENCSYTGSSTAFESGTGLRIDFVNSTSEHWSFWSFQQGRGIQVSMLVRPNGHNTGYLSLQPGSVELNCGSGTRDRFRAEVATYTVMAETLTVRP